MNTDDIKQRAAKFAGHLPDNGEETSEALARARILPRAFNVLQRASAKTKTTHDKSDTQTRHSLPELNRNWRGWRKAPMRRQRTPLIRRFSAHAALFSIIIAGGARLEDVKYIAFFLPCFSQQTGGRRRCETRPVRRQFAAVECACFAR